MTTRHEKFGADMNRFRNFLRHRPIKPITNPTFILSLLLILLSAWPVFGATYYVKNGGNDNVNGLSDATAWATIAKVNATAKSGDTVYFRSQDTWTSATPPVLTATAGVTYDGSTYGTGTRATLQATGNAITYPNYSTVKIEASNITFKGFNVDSNNYRTGGLFIGYMRDADTSDITIDNCVVHGIGGIVGDWTYGILVSNKLGHTVSNITITNTTVYDCFHEGIAIYPGWASVNDRNDTVLIRGCTVYNTGTIGSGGVGVEICNDSRNVTVEYCTLYNNDHGIWIRVSPSYEGYVNYAPQNMTIRYNIIHDNRYDGINITNWRTLMETGSFYGNLFYSNGKAGYVDTSDISFGDSSGSSDYTTDTVFNIYNNTFYLTGSPGTNSAAAIAFGYFGHITNGTFNLKNNIIYSGNYRAVVNKFGSLVTHSNNLIYSTSSGTWVTDGSSNYTSTGVKTWETTVQNTDPAFTGGTLPTGFSGTYGTNMVPNTPYFATTSGPAVNNGATLGSPYNGCINGAGLAIPITRPQGTAYGIGAYEYVDTIRPAPPTGLRLE
jgi:hypothetical protein